MCKLYKQDITTSYWIKTLQEDDQPSRRTQQMDGFRFIRHLNQIQEEICLQRYKHDKSFAQDIKLDLQNGLLHVREVQMASTYYSTNMDSFLTTFDVTWARQYFNNYIIEITSMWLIENMHHSTVKHMINSKKVSNVNRFVIILGFLWCKDYNPEIATVDAMKSIRKTSVPVAIDLKFIVQAVYVMHDHILAPKSAMEQLSIYFKKGWPKVQEGFDWWATEYEQDLIEHCVAHKLPYCGIGLICILHKQHLCGKCEDLSLTKENWKYIIYCCEDESACYKVYTIYQGYIVRYFNRNAINENTTHASDEIFE